MVLTSHALHTVDLDLHPNEASDLLPVESDELLRARGWDLAFWTVLDEGCVEDSIAVIGHTRAASPEDDAWEIVRPRFRVTDNAGRTEDAEACTRLDGWVYLVGSQYGSKAGPLETKRAFLARFRESDLAGDLEGSRPGDAGGEEQVPPPPGRERRAARVWPAFAGARTDGAGALHRANSPRWPARGRATDQRRRRPDQRPRAPPSTAAARFCSGCGTR